MKSYHIIVIGLALTVILSTVEAQNINGELGQNSDTICFVGLKVTPKIEAELAAIPLLNISPASVATTLPDGVDNSKRPVSRIGHDENTKHLLEALPRRDAPMTIVKRNHPTVSNLSTEIMENNEVLLTWNYPEGNLSEMTLSWSNMDMVDCFGFQAAQCATDQVQRFDTMDLRILDGWKIEDVTVILSPYDSVLISPYDTTYPPLGNYFIRIWKGDDTDLTMVYEQLIENPVFGRPLTVTLDSDVLVDANSELRVGYYLDQYTRYTWAFDSQSSTYEGKSALIQVYSNQSECNPNYWHFNHYYNLCISSTLTNPNGQGVAEGLTGY